jgi:tripartite-type tricarboxylate transporter receptor subunit TctC
VKLRRSRQKAGEDELKIFPIATALCLIVGSAVAQDYPCSQVKIVVPYPAGGATDVASRVLAERLEAVFKKTFFVENRGGATGNIGTAAVVAAPPDGCTLLVNATVIATFIHSFSKLPYDPFKDLAPVGGVGVTPTLIVAAASVPASDIKGLVKWSKTKPDGLNYSTAGYGLQQHLASEEIAQRTGAKFTHVAYRGGGTAMNDLIAARLDFGGFLAGTTKPLIASGQLKGIAIVAEKRSDLVPDIPTTTEQGLPGMDAHGVHFMLFAPSATPKPVVDMLSVELKKIIAEPKLKERFAGIGFDPTPMTAEEVTQAMRQTETKLAPVIKRLNIKLD